MKIDTTKGFTPLYRSDRSQLNGVSRSSEHDHPATSSGDNGISEHHRLESGRPPGRSQRDPFFRLPSPFQRIPPPSRRILLWLGLLVCGICFLWNSFPNPFDERPLSKQEAARAAITYFGMESGNVRTAVTYDADKPIIAYLQHEKLLDEYLHNYDHNYPLDYYRVEVEGPDAHRYFAIVHQYEGIVTGWSKDYRNQDRGRNNEQTGSEYGHGVGGDRHEIAARQVADAYLTRQYPRDLSAEAVTVHKEEDGSYTVHYAHHKDRIGEAYRITMVKVAGDSVVAYRSSFTPPDHFDKWLMMQDRRSGKLTNLALWTSIAFAAAALAYMIRNRGKFYQRGGFVLVSITVIIEAIYYMNTLPNHISKLTIEQAGPILLVFEFLFTVGIASIFGMLVYLPYAGGVTLLSDSGERHLLTPEWHADWRKVMMISYGLAIFILALQTLIFSVATSVFHVWWIPDPGLSTDNMLWPLLFPLTAWAAAISEEIVYRLFAVTFLSRIFKSRFAAILLSSMIWALGHTAYPVYPVYTRFVEVTILGIVFGYIFIKYGFAAAVFTHAIIDSILMGFDIMTDGYAGAIAAIIFILLPWLVGMWMSRWHTLPPYKPKIDSVRL